MDAVLSAESAGLASLLRASRELAGLSRSDVARCLGMSWETVRQAEEGRDVRHSTLCRLLLTFPHLGPRALVLGEAPSPPLASAAIWDFYRRHHGFVSSRVRHAVRLEADGSRTYRVEHAGVRWLGEPRGDRAHRTDLMRAVFLASGPLLRHLEAEDGDLADGRRIIDVDGVRHEFRFGRDRRGAFDYACSFRRESDGPESALQGEADAIARGAGAVTAKIGHPAERLELSLTVAATLPLPAVAFFVAPEMSVPQHGAVRLARSLHPGGVPLRWDRAERTATIAVLRPLPNLRHGLAWLPEPRPAAGFVALSPLMERRRARLGRAAASAAPGAQVAAARERAGMSRRDLARAMRASAATVIAVEAGDDARCSTLRRLVETLDDLEAEDLFAVVAGARPARPVTPIEAWLYYRNVVGLEAAEATRTLTLNPAGDGAEVITTRDLRSMHGGPREVIVQDGIAPGVHGKAGPVLLAQRSGRSRETLRVRWTRVPGESPEFQLMIPAALAAAGVSFDRRDSKELAYKLRPEHVDRSIGPAYECFVPVRRLVVSVRFPDGSWPAEIGPFVRAAVNVTNPRWPDLQGALHPDSVRWHVQRGASVRLEVDRPMFGFRYSISWKVQPVPLPAPSPARSRSRR